MAYSYKKHREVQKKGKVKEREKLKEETEKNRVPGVNITKEDFLEAFIEHNALLKETCKNIGLPYNTVLTWIHKDSEFGQRIDELRRIAVENAADVVIRAAEEGNIDAAKFILRTLGKHKGYTFNDKLEVTGTVNQNVHLFINPVRFVEFDDIEEEQDYKLKKL